ncbi:MAG: hypothetical protein COU51_02165 [Parcubacteria group bacterium CG10_big_fil_rev_8_21_14_0_10_36_14]|nr:MAG: hypothetical protein COU51_02165 [Parcubacteria group bacterium CG10_big_fil_rev_8_21_14_0_10_36_14]
MVFVGLAFGLALVGKNEGIFGKFLGYAGLVLAPGLLLASVRGLPIFFLYRARSSYLRGA